MPVPSRLQPPRASSEVTFPTPLYLLAAVLTALLALGTVSYHTIWRALANPIYGLSGMRRLRDSIRKLPGNPPFRPNQSLREGQMSQLSVGVWLLVERQSWNMFAIYLYVMATIGKNRTNCHAMDVTLDKFGRIVIPKKIRERLGIQPGSKLRLDLEDDRLALEPLRDEPILQRRGPLLVYTGEFVGDAGDAVQRDREQRIRKLSGL